MDQTHNSSVVERSIADFCSIVGRLNLMQYGIALYLLISIAGILYTLFCILILVVFKHQYIYWARTFVNTFFTVRTRFNEVLLANGSNS